MSPEIFLLKRLDEVVRFKISRALPVIYRGTKCNPLTITIITTDEIATKGSCTIKFNESLAFNEEQTFELRRRISKRPQIGEYDIKFLVNIKECHADWSDLVKEQQMKTLLPKVKVSFKNVLTLPMR